MKRSAPSVTWDQKELRATEEDARETTLHFTGILASGIHVSRLCQSIRGPLPLASAFRGLETAQPLKLEYFPSSLAQPTKYEVREIS